MSAAYPDCTPTAARESAQDRANDTANPARVRVRFAARVHSAGSDFAQIGVPHDPRHWTQNHTDACAADNHAEYPEDQDSSAAIGSNR
jgi:hypothetical protein